MTDKFTELSRTAAMTLLFARAFNLWNSRLEKQAKDLRQTHTRESKMALTMIVEGTKKMEAGLHHFEDWGTDACVTESGHHGDMEACDTYLTDGAWIAYLAGATFNATSYDPTIRMKIESMCKLATKGEPFFDWDKLKELMPK